MTDSLNQNQPITKEMRVRVTDRMEAVVEQFSAHGVELNPASRLRQYVTYFDQQFSYQDLTTQQYRWYYLEAMQFSLIARALPKILADEGASFKLNTAINGAMLPSEDSAGSRARSDQFELYVMAVLILSGLHVEIGEPDLWVDVEDQTIPIAVKRPRSTKKIYELIRKGSNQLSKCGTPGIVAIDLSFVEEITTPMVIQSAQHQQILAQELLDGFAIENDSKLMQQFDHRPHLIGCLMHLSICLTSRQPLDNLVSRRWLCRSKHYHYGLQKILNRIHSCISQ